MNITEIPFYNESIFLEGTADREPLVTSPDQFKQHTSACVEGSVTWCICDADKVISDGRPF